MYAGLRQQGGPVRRRLEAYTSVSGWPTWPRLLREPKARGVDATSDRCSPGNHHPDNPAGWPGRQGALANGDIRQRPGVADRVATRRRGHHRRPARPSATKATATWPRTRGPRTHNMTQSVRIAFRQRKEDPRRCVRVADIALTEVPPPPPTPKRPRHPEHSARTTGSARRGDAEAGQSPVNAAVIYRERGVPVRRLSRGRVGGAAVPRFKIAACGSRGIGQCGQIKAHGIPLIGVRQGPSNRAVHKRSKSRQ